MTACKSAIILVTASIFAAVLLAGCAGLAPTVTPAPSAPPTISPAPSPIGGSDEAIINLTYTVNEYRVMYEGIPIGPGEVMYGLDVSVNSDKPVSTDWSWFSVEYRQNGTSELRIYPAMTVRDYPETIIGNGSKPATGRVLIVLPEPGPGSYGPVPVYFKPLDEQTGPYYVKSPVRGIIAI